MTTGPRLNKTTRLVGDEALDVLFRKARTHNEWLDKPLDDDALRTLYELMKWGGTSAEETSGIWS